MSTPIRTPLGDVNINAIVNINDIPEEFISDGSITIRDDGHPPLPPSTPFVEKIYICRRND
jgi:hypothetical protein